LAIRQARPETTTFKTTDQLRAGREGFHCVDTIAAEVVDDTGLAANAGNNAAILDHRHIVARTGFTADQAVIPADILLGEGGIETLGRRLEVIHAIPGQRVADKALVEFLTVIDEHRGGRISILDNLAFHAGEQRHRKAAGQRHAGAELATSGLGTIDGAAVLIADAVIDVHAGRHLETHETGLGEREVKRAAGLRGADGSTQILTTTQEIALGKRDFA